MRNSLFLRPSSRWVGSSEPFFCKRGLPARMFCPLIERGGVPLQQQAVSLGKRNGFCSGLDAAFTVDAGQVGLNGFD